jgi:hypothetical protein
MKKSILFSALLFASVICMAQVEVNGFAGPRANTARYTIKNVKQNTGYTLGMEAGLGLKIPFDINLFFCPAIFYSFQGYSVDFNAPSFPPDVLAKNNNLVFHAFDIAPLLQYDLGKSDRHYFIKAGPSLEFVMAGKEKFDLQTGENVTRQMKFGREDYGHYLASFLVQFGYEHNENFAVYIEYARELGTMVNTTGGPEVKPRGISLVFAKKLCTWK